MKQDVYEVRDIFHVIRHYFWTIFTITLLVTAIGAFITYFILTPVYQAKTQVLILDTTIYKDKKESREEPSPAPSEEPSPQAKTITKRRAKFSTKRRAKSNTKRRAKSNTK